MLDQIRGNPNYVLRFMDTNVLEKQSLPSDLEEARKQTCEHMQLLKQCGVQNAWVNTYHMKHDNGFDGLWTVTENITRITPQTPEEVRAYIAHSATCMRGLLTYFEKCRKSHLYDLTRREQWVYGKNLKEELGMYLVDTDPRFAEHPQRKQAMVELQEFIQEEIGQIQYAWPHADQSELRAVLADHVAVHGNWINAV